MIPEEVQKVYWRIGEVADRLNVSTSCIRFWIREFNLHVNRVGGPWSNRKFRQGDIDTLKEIHRLLIVERYTMEGAKRQLQLQTV